MMVVWSSRILFANKGAIWSLNKKNIYPKFWPRPCSSPTWTAIILSCRSCPIMTVRVSSGIFGMLSINSMIWFVFIIKELRSGASFYSADSSSLGCTPRLYSSRLLSLSRRSYRSYYSAIAISLLRCLYLYYYCSWCNYRYLLSYCSLSTFFSSSKVIFAFRLYDTFSLSKINRLYDV